MDQNKIKEIFADETFVKNLMTLETAGDVQKALKAKGIEASIAEIEQLKKAVAQAGSGEEMSLEEMDTAAGGAGIPFESFSVNYGIEYYMPKDENGNLKMPSW